MAYFLRLYTGYGIAVDSSGNVYVTGCSYSPWNGPGGFIPLNAHTNSYNDDIAIIKLNNSGAYQWHTFYGSSIAGEEGKDLVTDAAGNVYITGSGQWSWNGPGDILPLHAFAGGVEITVIKLNSSGAYQWHTFYGSVNTDEGYGISLDGAGKLCIAAMSNTGWNGPGNIPPLNAHAGDEEITILVLGSTGAYQWHTFYGSSSPDYGRGIATDSLCNIYVTGESYRTWDGPGSAAPLHAFTGSAYNISVVKMAYMQPVATTLAATGTGTSSATLNMSYTTGEFSPVNIRFAYRKAGETAWTCTAWVPKTAGGSYSQTITGLIPGTTYEFKAELAYTSNTIAGAILQFNTTNSAIGTGALSTGALSTGTGSSSTFAIPSQPPVSLPNIYVQSASLSASRVGPGSPVTVTASVANRGTVNGSTHLKVFVNGREEASCGVMVNSGSNRQVSFTVNRNEPGTYNVYVGGTHAGSFTVDNSVDSNTVLFISFALVLAALVLGAVYLFRRSRYSN